MATPTAVCILQATSNVTASTVRSPLRVDGTARLASETRAGADATHGAGRNGGKDRLHMRRRGRQLPPREQRTPHGASSFFEGAPW